MKPSLFAALCALLLFLPTPGGLSAEDGDDPFSPFRVADTPDHSPEELEPAGDSPTIEPATTRWSRLREAERRINGTLDQPLNSSGLHFVEEPLNNVLNVIEEEYDIPIVIDESALKELGITADTEVTVNLRNITLRSALNHLLRSPGVEDLTFVNEDEVLLVTTKDAACAALTVRVYPVVDLLQRQKTSGFISGSDPLEFTDLTEVIVSSVEHDSWLASGNGEGYVALAYPGVLVVSQTARVHEEIEKLLADIRATAPEDHADRENPF